MTDRRRFLGLAAAGLAGVAAPALARRVGPAPLDLLAAVAAAEAATGGRVGLAVHDLATGRRFAHRGDERFPMASTFKALLVAAILARVDRGEDRLDRAIAVRAEDIVDVSPVSKAHVGGTASLAELCEATIIHSDNAAANLLLPAVGGPAGLTAWLRRGGDAVTRLDRFETMMSEGRPGDPRDTTSPAAMLATLERLLLGAVLRPASRRRLIGWLIANTTGGTRLRAGLPADWTIGDKTGAGGHGTVNDIAIVWPRRAAPAPLVIACYLTGGTAATTTLHAAHADIARAIASAVTS